MNEEYVKYEKESAVNNKQSFRISAPAAILDDDELTDKEKLLYMLMVTYASKSGECFASNNRLANQLHCGMSTVSKGISKLNAQGWIDVKLVYKEDSKEIKNRIVQFPLERKRTKKQWSKLPDPMEM